MKIKICGIKNSTDAKAALEVGADALGFSVGTTLSVKDEIKPETARKIIKTLPPFVSSVMVTHLVDKSEIVEMAKYLCVNTIQIQNDISAEEIEFIKEQLPFCKIIKTIYVSDERKAVEAIRTFEDVCDGLLLDLRTTEGVSEADIARVWNIGVKAVEVSRIPVVLAGDLTDDNVYEAILKVKPYGVNVSAGVERCGMKSFEKTARFVNEAERAFRKNAEK